MRICLLVDGESLPVAQTGGGRIILDAPIRLTATTGELIMQIDGQVRRWQVSMRPPAAPSRIIPATFEPIK